MRARGGEGGRGERGEERGAITVDSTTATPAFHRGIISPGKNSREAVREKDCSYRPKMSVRGRLYKVRK